DEDEEEEDHDGQDDRHDQRIEVADHVAHGTLAHHRRVVQPPIEGRLREHQAASCPVALWPVSVRNTSSSVGLRSATFSTGTPRCANCSSSVRSCAVPPSAGTLRLRFWASRCATVPTSAAAASARLASSAKESSIR